MLAFLFWFLFGGLFAEKVTHVQISYRDEITRLTPAAEKGDLASQHRLGVILRDGKAGKSDYAGALVWLRKAAGKGHAGARYALGQMFAAGQGVRPSYPQAAKLYLSAAKFGGHADAGYALGELYFFGQGVGQDYGAAIGWYKKAASQGHPAARAVLAAMYEKGWGVGLNLVEAFYWYSLAATQAGRVRLYRPEMDVAAALEKLSGRLSRLQMKKARAKLAASRNK
ncbi:MAG: tetratricopeptide repeat protein [Rhodospirillales bacterium]|nr:tetratricopeptide repeat protein [Rhodospirillales bacterium]